jgi:hypothetical protein
MKSASSHIFRSDDQFVLLTLRPHFSPVLCGYALLVSIGITLDRIDAEFQPRTRFHTFAVGECDHARRAPLEEAHSLSLHTCHYSA